MSEIDDTWVCLKLRELQCAWNWGNFSVPEIEETSMPETEETSVTETWGHLSMPETEDTSVTETEGSWVCLKLKEFEYTWNWGNLKSLDSVSVCVKYVAICLANSEGGC
jgi:hypothetical protein